MRAYFFSSLEWLLFLSKSTSGFSWSVPLLFLFFISIISAKIDLVDKCSRTPGYNQRGQSLTNSMRDYINTDSKHSCVQTDIRKSRSHLAVKKRLWDTNIPSYYEIVIILLRPWKVVENYNQLYPNLTATVVNLRLRTDRLHEEKQPINKLSNSWMYYLNNNPTPTQPTGFRNFILSPGHKENYSKTIFGQSVNHLFKQKCPKFTCSSL